MLPSSRNRLEKHDDSMKLQQRQPMLITETRLQKCYLPVYSHKTVKIELEFVNRTDGSHKRGH